MDENRDDGMSVEEKCEEYTKAETSENAISPITNPEKGMWDWILSDDDDCSGDAGSDDTIGGSEAKPQEDAVEGIRNYTVVESKGEPYGDRPTIAGPNTETETDVLEHIKDKTNNGPKAEPHEDAWEGLKYDTVPGPNTENGEYAWKHIKDRANDGSKAEPHEDAREGLNDDTILAPKTEKQVDVREHIKEKTNDGSKAEPHEDAREGTNDGTILEPKTELWAHVGENIEDKTDDRSKPFPHNNATEGMKSNTKEELKVETQEDYSFSTYIQRSTNYFSKNETAEDDREGIKDKTKEGLKLELHGLADEDIKSKTNAESRTEQQKDATKDMEDTTDSKTNEASTTMFGTMKTIRPGTKESSSPLPMVGIQHSASPCKVSERTCTSFLGTTSTVASLFGTTKPNTSSSLFSVSTCGTSVSAPGLTSTSNVTIRPGTTESSSPSPVVGIQHSASTCKVSERTCTSFLGTASTVASLFGTTKPNTSSSLFSVSTCGISASAPGLTSTSNVTIRPGTTESSSQLPMVGIQDSASTCKVSERTCTSFLGTTSTVASLVGTTKPNTSSSLFSVSTCGTSVSAPGLTSTSNVTIRPGTTESSSPLPMVGIQHSASTCKVSERTCTSFLGTTSTVGGRSNTGAKLVEDPRLNRSLELQNEYYRVLCRTQVTKIGLLEKQNKIQSVRLSALEDDVSDLSKSESRLTAENTVLKEEVAELRKLLIRKEETLQKRTYTNHQFSEKSTQTEILQQEKKENQSQNTSKNEKKGQGLGTFLKFRPRVGWDSEVDNGVTKSVTTWHQCISAMISYQSKSLEELRFEDYLVNRKPHSKIIRGFAFGREPIVKASTGSGTSPKFIPPFDVDKMIKNGNVRNIYTRHQCITAMQFYQTKSLEELRLEDYLNNRKFPSQITDGLAFGQKNIGVFASQAPVLPNTLSEQNKNMFSFATTEDKTIIPAFGGLASPFDTRSQVNTTKSNTQPLLFGTRPSGLATISCAGDKILGFGTSATAPSNSFSSPKTELCVKPFSSRWPVYSNGSSSQEENMKQGEDSWTRNDFQSLHLQTLSDKVEIMVLQEELDEFRKLLIRKEETLQKRIDNDQQISEKLDQIEILQQESEAYQFMIKTKNELIENLTNQLKEKKREFKGLSKTNHRYLEQMAKMRLHCHDNPETPVKEMVSKICQTGENG